MDRMKGKGLRGKMERKALGTIERRAFEDPGQDTAETLGRRCLRGSKGWDGEAKKGGMWGHQDKKPVGALTGVCSDPPREERGLTIQ